MPPDAGAAYPQLAAILLAAGGSTRLGQPKQGFEIDGEALVVRQARLLLSLRPATVIVVTGAEPSEVEPLLAELPLRIEHNPEWRKGMGSSLARGIRMMPERVRAALVLLCDQWKITSADLQVLARAWSEDPGAVVAASYSGTVGVPAILPRAMFERLARLRGDTGARRLIKGWHGQVRSIAMPRAAADIDTVSDLPRQ